jgi:hypothetical protein
MSETSPHSESAPKWGDPISDERQVELQGILDSWSATTDHGKLRGPFDGVHLTGADTFHPAARSRWSSW